MAQAMGKGDTKHPPCASHAGAFQRLNERGQVMCYDPTRSVRILGISTGDQAMVFLVFCIFVLAVVYLLWRLGARPASRRYGWRHLWRAACLVGFVRIGALWVGVAAYQRPGWPQIPGYFLQLLALPEIYLMRGMRGQPRK